jgi:hypothetical protein
VATLSWRLAGACKWRLFDRKQWAPRERDGSHAHASAPCRHIYVALALGGLACPAAAAASLSVSAASRLQAPAIRPNAGAAWSSAAVGRLMPLPLDQALP